ncbi:helix-turn-helix transcriptional regulator [Achromobacter sp. Bel]|uniref:AraC family transcriptional regulator n=1 Tax=Achromobacter sp. Bel TaxID=2727415 RepID=UPI00145CD971|nr:helix-turn-helix transcriptional regulator [Achromobacter sp. Bel]NMK50475.1 helix-turn-helix transcriptional regulator [Achromobacter sp. Bel]
MDIPAPPSAGKSRAPAEVDLFPYESSQRPVAGLAVDYEDGHRVRRHRHRRGQLLYAISGVMTVDTDAGIWVVPPTRGVWVPAWVPHGIRMSGEPRMRTVFVEPGTAAHLPEQCCVLSISPLLRELMVAAADVPLDWAPGTRDGRVMMLLLDELRQEPVLPLHLPQPSEPRLARICRAIVRHPERQAGAADWARELGVDAKTVHRLFLRHTGMTFGRWRQQARLLAAMERLARGARVLDVALDLGYDSPSAFAAMFRRAVGEPPSVFAARGGASA